MTGQTFKLWADLSEFLRQAQKISGDPQSEGVHEARKKYDQFLGFLTGPTSSSVRWQDVSVKADDREIPIRLVWPDKICSTVPLVYIRGGGWWAGSLASSFPLVEFVAQACGHPVCMVDFRRTPEFHYPAQLDDCLEAVTWISANARSLDMSPDSCILWGESAGATLAVQTALELKQRQKLHMYSDVVAGLVLLYGNFAGPAIEPSSRSQWIWDNYLGKHGPFGLNDVIVLDRDLSHLPRCWLGVGDLDPLLNDSLALAQALHQWGVSYRLRIFQGLPHSFLPMFRLLEPAYQAALEAVQAVNDFEAAKAA